MSLRVLSVVGVCFASTAAFAQSTETPPLEAETAAPSADACQSVQDGDELLDTEHEMDLRRQPSVPRPRVSTGSSRTRRGSSSRTASGSLAS